MKYLNIVNIVYLLDCLCTLYRTEKKIREWMINGSISEGLKEKNTAEPRILELGWFTIHSACSRLRC